MSSSSAAGRVCAWDPDHPIPAGARADAVYCSVVCRKRAWRFQRAVPARGRAVGPLPGRRDASRGSPGPMRLAYADPPYPTKAHYYVENAEVDHASLVDRLQEQAPDGWALSTSAAALQDVLAVCPAGTRVACWRRRVRHTRSARALSAWEPLLVQGGRPLPVDGPQALLDALATADLDLDDRELCDWLDYRGRYGSFPGALVGMKPPEFSAWMFRLLGAQAGDTLLDVYPGSGAVTRAWQLYVSPVDERRVVPPDGGQDASSSAGETGRVPEYLRDETAPGAGGTPGRPGEPTRAA